MIHATEDFFSPLREISHHSGFFSGRFPIPTDGIFPPCWNFSDLIPIPDADTLNIGEKVAEKSPF
jgi:hypothetical protein